MCVPEILLLTILLSFCVYLWCSTKEKVTDNYLPTSTESPISKISRQFRDNSQEHKKLIIGGNSLPSEFSINNENSVELIQMIKENEREEERDEEEEQLRLARNKKNNARDSREND